MSTVRAFVLLNLTAALLLPTSRPAALASVGSPDDSSVGPEASALPDGLIRPDGTLNLDTGYSGSLNLEGWNVQLDSDRGPLLNTLSGTQAAGAAATTNGWSDVGGGGGSSINREVTAMAVMGGDLYVGGWFVDLDDNPAADYIARWNGTSWSAVGAGANGDGSLRDGGVTAMAVDGSTLYAGGWFCGVSNGGSTNFKACRIAKWDGSSWTNLGDNGGSSGSISLWVDALAVDASHNVYAGGAFTNVNNHGSVLTAADYIAMWDGSDWHALGSDGGVPANGSVSAEVQAIAIDGTDVYVGGRFTSVNNGGTPIDTADYIAKWNGSGWSEVGNNGSGQGSLNSWVLALEMDASGNLYAGGYFTSVTNSDGIPVSGGKYVAMWDGSSWSALGSNGFGGGSLNSSVFALAVDGAGNLYAGGFFTNVTNSDGTPEDTADYIAMWDPVTEQWSGLGDNGAGDGSIKDAQLSAIAVDGSDVYAGGSFVGVHNGTTLINHAVNVAQWSGSAWSALGAPQGVLNNVVQAIAVQGNKVYVGGQFTHVSNHGAVVPGADYLAVWDGKDWAALGAGPSGTAAVNSPVYAIAVDGGNVYVGGSFNYVDNLSAAWRIARWDGSDWSALGNDGAVTPGPSLNGTVQAIAVDGAGRVYAGGGFTNVKNQDGSTVDAADYVAIWDPTTNLWSSLGDNGAGDGSLSNPVYTVAIHGTKVYVGGAFVNVTDSISGPVNTADYVAKWDGSQWSALGSNGSGNGALSDYVLALAVDAAGQVYAGGYFTNIEDSINGSLSEADRVAKWDPTTGAWSALGSNGNNDGAIAGLVRAVAVSGSNVYVGGEFESVNNNGAPIPEAGRIARWDGTNWAALGSDGTGGPSINTPSANATVYAIGIDKTRVYAGGYFFDVNNSGSVRSFADYLASYRQLLSITYRSQGGNDGWVLESTENSGVGGSTNSGASAFNVGDDGGNRQYRGVVSFNTSSLPDAAVISSAKLTLKKNGQVGSDPFATLGNLAVDVRKGAFGGNAALELGDFGAAASKNGALSFTSGGFAKSMKTKYFKYINRTGVTQFRLRFALDDNNNGTADYLLFYSGNAATSKRPTLVIKYYAP